MSTMMPSDTTPRRRTRWRESRGWRVSRGWLAVAAVAVLFTIVLIASRTQTSGVPLAPDNPGQNGARALAQILGREGVQIRSVRTVAEASEAADQAAGAATVLVAGDFGMTGAQARQLQGISETTVLLAPQADLLTTLVPGASYVTRTTASGPIAAQCADPDATAAGSLSETGSGLSTASATATPCFVVDGGAAMVRDGAVTALDSALPFTNAHLAADGNAALGLRLLGAQPTLIWLVPDRVAMQEVTAIEHEDARRWIGPAVWVLIVSLGLAVWWRGRRLGALVPEPMPVVVHSSESTVGRARLYRRSRDTGHAAALLRAGTVTRIAARIGLDRSTSPAAVVEAISVASGRPPSAVHDLLYGPAPASATELALLTTELDHLSREVRRP